MKNQAIGCLLACLLMACLHPGCSSDGGGDVGNKDASDLQTALETTVPCGGCEPGTYCNFDQCEPSSVSMPQDAAPHECRIEWWYYTGHLTDGTGQWGFEIALFEQRVSDLLPDIPNDGMGYMCHVAILDEVAKDHVFTENGSFEPKSWSSDPVDLQVLNCHLEISGDGHDRIRGRIPVGEEGHDDPGDWGFDLQLDTTKPLIHHGGNGIIPMSEEGGDSWYYSYTRLAAQGTLTTPDGDRPVTGQAWMDHQWGEFDSSMFLGWDWWSMQFDDGWEIMLFQFRDWTGELVTQAGTLVDPDGNITAIEGMGAFQITSLREWKSPHSDGAYPLDWDIVIPEMDWKLESRALFDDQEVPNFVKTYWEGSVTITGTRGDTPVTGVGFTELTGYAESTLGLI
ncbi:MAG: hypothetical protein ISR64_07140 [Deltaproteobacteria bacterium]|nr:hypothetical protein [Deltaproteobacteria bacterium]